MVFVFNNEFVGTPFDYFVNGVEENWLSNDFLKKDGASITRQVYLSNGDKIKMRGRIIQGDYGETAAHTVRLRIKKLFS